MSRPEVPEEEINRVYRKLKGTAEAGGYHLNPDVEFTKSLIKGLLENERRYGYRACPCRLAAGHKRTDLDIVCPCDYRDADVTEYGQCYCGLYVSEAIREGKQPTRSIPERRTKKDSHISGASPATALDLAFPIWRCRVCGYLCARGAPPEVCPVCKAKKERFEKLIPAAG